MPPKKKFSEEQIIDAAFEIAKTEGMDSITIRKVAFQMGLSIMVANRLLPEEFTMEKRMEILDSIAEDVVIATRIRKK